MQDHSISKFADGFRFGLCVNIDHLHEAPRTLAECLGPLAQLLRVMYIYHAWIATGLLLQESKSIDGRYVGQTAKRSV
jgi:hypothetical protein